MSAALRSMLRVTPSGRAMVISRPSIVTVLREIWVWATVTPPRRRTSSRVGPLASPSMRLFDTILWATECRDTLSDPKCLQST